MQARIPLPAEDQMSDAQREIYASLLRTRPSADGPFLAWLHSPGLAGPAEKLGAYCRFHTALSQRETELLILVTAARFDCVGEWTIHAPIAAREGLADHDIEAIRAGAAPVLASERDLLLWRLAVQLLTTNRVSQETFDAARAELGLPALVDAVGVIGYYSFVAATLNAFEMYMPSPDATLS